MYKWEITRIWVPLDTRTETSDGVFYEESLTTISSTFEHPEAQKAWATAESYSANGWELVTAIPRLTGFISRAPSVGVHTRGGTSITSGFWLIFKRLLSD